MPTKEKGMMAAEKKLVTQPLRLVSRIFVRVLQDWFQKVISYMLIKMLFKYIKYQVQE